MEWRRVLPVRRWGNQALRLGGSWGGAAEAEQGVVSSYSRYVHLPGIPLLLVIHSQYYGIRLTVCRRSRQASLAGASEWSLNFRFVGFTAHLICTLKSCTYIENFSTWAQLWALSARGALVPIDHTWCPSLISVCPPLSKGHWALRHSVLPGSDPPTLSNPYFDGLAR